MEQKIEAMIKQVAKRKTELAELRGEKTQILKQMNEEDCKTAEDIEKEITKEERKITKLSSQIEADVKSLESDYDWS